MAGNEEGLVLEGKGLEVVESEVEKCGDREDRVEAVVAEVEEGGDGVG